MFLIVGLGNPGKFYKNNTHNIGYKIVDNIRETYNFPDFSKKFKSEFSKSELNKNILFLLKPEKPKVIATTASLFILINSISGILGQFTKENTFYELTNYWTLFLSVLIGGFIGNYLNLKILSNRTLTIMTSLLVIFVYMRIGIRLFL